MDSSNANSCPDCKAPVESGAAFCTNCGTRLPEITAATRVDTVAPSPSLSNSAARVTAAQPAFEPPATPAFQPELGQTAHGSKAGPLIILVLVLVIIGAVALFWLRPSGSQSSTRVLILTPVAASLTVDPDSTSTLGVTVQGDGGAGVTWKIAESYGGRIEPAGVTILGKRMFYQASYHAGGTPGDYHVIATSAASKQSHVTITVHVER
jgi:hypothetical protein